MWYRERLLFLLEDKGEIKELRTLLANLREEGEEEEEEEEHDNEGQEEDEKEGSNLDNDDTEEENGEEETKEHDSYQFEEKMKEENLSDIEEVKRNKVHVNSSHPLENEKTPTASMSLQLPERGMDIGVSVGTNTSLTDSTDMSGVEGTVESSSSSALQGLSPMIISALLTPPRTKIPLLMDSRVLSDEERESRTRGRGQEGRGGTQGGDSTSYTLGIQVNNRPSSKETAVTGWHTRELL